jgi:hypothetical protein
VSWDEWKGWASLPSEKVHRLDMPLGSVRHRENVNRSSVCHLKFYDRLSRPCLKRLSVDQTDLVAFLEPRRFSRPVWGDKCYRKTIGDLFIQHQADPVFFALWEGNTMTNNALAVQSILEMTENQAK